MSVLGRRGRSVVPTSPPQGKVISRWKADVLWSASRLGAPLLLALSCRQLEYGLKRPVRFRSRVTSPGRESEHPMRTHTPGISVRFSDCRCALVSIPNAFRFRPFFSLQPRCNREPFRAPRTIPDPPSTRVSATTTPSVTRDSSWEIYCRDKRDALPFTIAHLLSCPESAEPPIHASPLPR